jgi:hypothetical protein
MTTPPTNEAHLLVIFGEVRGDVKALLRSQLEMNERFAANEKHTDERFEKLEDRIGALERYRLKVAGFTLAIASFLTLTQSKLAPLADAFFQLFGV